MTFTTLFVRLCLQILLIYKIKTEIFKDFLNITFILFLHIFFWTELFYQFCLSFLSRHHWNFNFERTSINTGSTINTKVEQNEREKKLYWKKRLSWEKRKVLLFSLKRLKQSSINQVDCDPHTVLLRAVFYCICRKATRPLEMKVGLVKKFTREKKNKSSRKKVAGRPVVKQLSLKSIMIYFFVVLFWCGD